MAGDCLFYARLAWPKTCARRPRQEGRDAGGEGSLPSFPIWCNSRGSISIVFASLVGREPDLYCLLVHPASRYILLSLCPGLPRGERHVHRYTYS